MTIDRKKITRGKRPMPLKVLCWGVEGVGKTTFAAGAPSVRIVDLDRGSYEQNVERVEAETFDEVLEWIEDARVDPTVESLAVDSLSRLEALICTKVCGPSATGGLAEYGGGWGKGDDAALQYWRQFLGACDRLNQTKNVILIGHALIKSFADPLGLTYDRFTLALREKAAGPVMQWVNYSLFARSEVTTRLNDKTKKSLASTSGLRFLWTDANPAYNAKHRGTLPAQLPLSWEAFSDAVIADRTSCEEKLEQIEANLLLVTDAAVVSKVRVAMKIADKDAVQLSAILGRVRAIVDTSKSTISSEVTS